MAKEAAETVVLVIDEEGIEPLLAELVKGVSDSQVFLLILMELNTLSLLQHFPFSFVPDL